MRKNQNENLFPHFKLKDFLVNIALNTAIPYLLYIFSKKYVTQSEFAALSIACIYPIGDNLVSVIRKKTLDIIAMITLLSIAVSIIAIFFGGSPKLLLIRESFFTGALGIICFISLLLPKPLMFYFGRQMMVENNKEEMDKFNQKWEKPVVKKTFRLITTVWGVAYLGEFLLRVMLVLKFSTAVVLVVSPVILNGVIIATILWTLDYVRRIRKQAQNVEK